MTPVKIQEIEFELNLKNFKHSQDKELKDQALKSTSEFFSSN